MYGSLITGETLGFLPLQLKLCPFQRNRVLVTAYLPYHASVVTLFVACGGRDAGLRLCGVFLLACVRPIPRPDACESIRKRSGLPLTHSSSPMRLLPSSKKARPFSDKFKLLGNAYFWLIR